MKRPTKVITIALPGLKILGLWLAALVVAGLCTGEAAYATPAPTPASHGAAAGPAAYATPSPTPASGGADAGPAASATPPATPASGDVVPSTPAQPGSVGSVGKPAPMRPNSYCCGHFADGYFYFWKNTGWVAPLQCHSQGSVADLISAGCQTNINSIENDGYQSGAQYLNMYTQPNYSGAYACIAAGDAWADLGAGGYTFSHYGSNGYKYGQRLVNTNGTVNVQIRSVRWVTTPC